jgi:hypothetical protein
LLRQSKVIQLLVTFGRIPEVFDSLIFVVPVNFNPLIGVVELLFEENLWFVFIDVVNGTNVFEVHFAISVYTCHQSESTSSGRSFESGHIRGNDRVDVEVSSQDVAGVEFFSDIGLIALHHIAYLHSLKSALKEELYSLPDNSFHEILELIWCHS